MRVLRLVDEGSFAVEFHPYITVVDGLSADQHDALVEAIEAAAQGRTTGLTGLIEAHGVVLDLDDQTLGLLDLGATPVEVIVVADDLPGAAPSGVGSKVRAAERQLEALEQPQRDRIAALTAAEEALEEARRLAAEARAAAEQPSPDRWPVDERATDDEAPGHDQPESPSAVDPGAQRRAELEERCADLEQRLARARDAIDQDSIAALDQARTELDRLLDAEPHAPPPEGGTSPEPAQSPDDDQHAAAVDEDRVRRIAELRETVALHELDDPRGVRDALDQVRRDHATGELVPSAEALSLADRLDELERQLGQVEISDPPPATEHDEAVERLHRARERVLELERSAPAGRATAKDLEELERVHAEVDSAREATEGRLLRGRAQRRLEAALAAEEEVLDRLGLQSYADYLMRGGSVRSVEFEAPELRAAQEEERAAEADLRDLETRIEEALRHAALVEDRRQLRDRARQLLDDPDVSDDHLNTALLSLRVPADADGPVVALIDALEGVGIPVRDAGLSQDEIEALASDWLSEYVQTEARLSSIADELRALESSEPAPQVAIELDIGAGAGEGVARGQASSGPDAEAHRAAEHAIEAAVARVAAHDRAVAEVAELEAALAETRIELDELAAIEIDHENVESAGEEIERADAAVAEAEDAVRRAAADVDGARTAYEAAVEELAVLRQMSSDLERVAPPADEVEWYLLARLAAQRNASFAGSVPLVVDGALDDVLDDEGLDHLLDRLERMAGAVQIIHLTSDRRIIRWASGLDDGRAAVVQPVASRER